MSCFRYVTPVVQGPWRGTQSEALSDALRAGQAYLQKGEVTLFEFTRIEEQPEAQCCPGGLAKD